MHIISLDIANIMRISTAFIAAEGESVVTVGGKNGHGKSSCLGAIAMALGGKKLCPPEPLRRGEHHGHVTVDLGPYVITRRFWRNEDDTLESSLQVQSPDGAAYKSPQTLLDKLVSDLTFDPLAFLDLPPKDQREYVRKFVGLDFRALDAQRAAALEAARECETVLKIADHDVKAGEFYADAPDAPVDIDALLAGLAAAETAERAASDADRAVDAKRRAYQATLEALTRNDQAIAALEQQLQAARALGVTLAETKVREEAEGQSLRQAAVAARAVVPDTSVLRAQLAQATTINARVQANRRHAALLDARDQAREELTQVRTRIAAIDADKQRHLAAAAFPVPGLSFSDDGLMFDGLPFEQASYAQQLRTAVAMGLASHPTLKVLLIRHGNALDRASLALLGEMAAAAGAQVWIEKVAETGEGVSVFLEDGAVTLAAGRPASGPVRICSECGVEWSGTLRACSCDAPAVVETTGTREVARG